MWFSLFKKKSVRGNLYLQKHGLYKSDGYPIGEDGRSMPMLPYVVTDLLLMRRENINYVYVNSNEFSFRWAWRTFRGVFSPNIQMIKMTHERVKFVVKKADIKQKLADYQAQKVRLFDLVILDGSDKLAAGKLLLECASPRAIFLLPMDITDLTDYDGVKQFLREHNFKIVNFVNPAPVIDSMGCAVCYRNDNVLDF